MSKQVFFRRHNFSIFWFHLDCIQRNNNMILFYLFLLFFNLQFVIFIIVSLYFRCSNNIHSAILDIIKSKLTLQPPLYYFFGPWTANHCSPHRKLSWGCLRRRIYKLECEVFTSFITPSEDPANSKQYNQNGVFQGPLLGPMIFENHDQCQIGTRLHTLYLPDNLFITLWFLPPHFLLIFEIFGGILEYLWG